MSKEVSIDLQRDLQKAEKAIKSILNGKSDITVERLQKLQETLQFALTSTKVEIKHFAK